MVSSDLTTVGHNMTCQVAEENVQLGSKGWVYITLCGES